MLTFWSRALSEPFQVIRQAYKGLVLGIFILASLFALNQLKYSRYFPIQDVKVFGVSHLATNSLQAVLEPLVSQGFFAINVDAIRDRLLQLPWVSQASVKRLWPNSIEVIINEKTPVARWNKTSVLSDAGELFQPEEDAHPLNLVDFSGPDGGQIIMLQYFYQIDRILSPLHAKILSLELTPYMTWKLTLDNGIVLQIGHKDILSRLTEFVNVYPKMIGDQAANVDYVDLRYPNGMAVRWKTPTHI